MKGRSPHSRSSRGASPREGDGDDDDDDDDDDEEEEEES
jgi:hypothetical protein